LPPALRAKFDSIDVVQSVWVTILPGFQAGQWHFKDANHLRAFLVRATHNRFVDRIRQNTRAVECEEPLREQVADAIVSHDPRPSEVFQAGEMWQQILNHCPPAHHELLRLKREGRSLVDIAERTGLHPDSIRRILRDLARRVALSASPEETLKPSPNNHHRN